MALEDSMYSGGNSAVTYPAMETLGSVSEIKIRFVASWWAVCQTKFQSQDLAEGRRDARDGRDSQSTWREAEKGK